jgi:PqqD family protein of HPr-rel-A system
MTSDTQLAPAASVHWNDAGRELVVFDSVSGSYHALNGSAAAIWRALVEARSAAAVVDLLAARFDADREVIAADVAAFLSKALAAGLISEVK